MPELPEVETVRRGLEPIMAGKKILSLMLRRGGLRTPFTSGLQKIVEKQRIVTLRRRAKYILIDLDGKAGDIIVLHLGMSGQMRIVAESASYKPLKHDHVFFALEGGTGVAFNDARRFGMMFLTSRADWEEHPAFRALGPEPLSIAFGGGALFEKLKNKKVSVKVALLDQRVVAGVGNIYASEALYAAGISPFRLSSSLSEKECGLLAKSIKEVLTSAIAAGGSTLKDHRQADGELGYFQHRFRVYGKAGEPCPRCNRRGKKKTFIEKEVQGGRATYWCRSCQK
jgi:formamidopyrimidine-DNA glycosylase